MLAVGFDAVDGSDVRMIERGEDAGLAAETGCELVTGMELTWNESAEGS